MATMFDTAEAARASGLARATLAKLRVEGGGPRFIKVGSKVLYPADELERWLSERPRQAKTTRKTDPQAA